MKYFNLNDKNELVSFEQAVTQGLGKNKGLFFPLSIPYFNNINYEQDFQSLALEVLQPYIGEAIHTKQLKNIIQQTCAFDFPLITLEKNKFIVELFHGPTLAFKDVGAQFMALCLDHFSEKQIKKTRVLVATSGDTGSAVASGFYGVENVEVIILFPKDKVSEIQELQLTTFGGNISAYAVEGSFDDCQNLVKEAFNDSAIFTKYNNTSANSINVARWLPQTLYYLKTIQTLVLKGFDKISFSVPSGNFGNICAGMLLQKMGFPIRKFVAATNVNDTIPRYFQNKIIEIKPTISTLSNAMDVSLPSNFIRIQQLYGNDFDTLQKTLNAISFNDEETKKAILHLYKTYNYITCPHSAIGYLGMQSLNPNANEACVCLSTAHPVKFADSVEQIIETKIPEPSTISMLRPKNKIVTVITKNYNEFQQMLLQ